MNTLRIISFCSYYLIFPTYLYSSNCLQSSSQIILNINNARAILLNNGTVWNNSASSVSGGFIIPNDTSESAVAAFYSGAIWMGGRRAGDNQLFVSASTYLGNAPYSYWPGPVNNLTGSVTSQECFAFDRHFKVDKKEIIDFRFRFQNNQITSISNVPSSILLWPGKNNPYLPSLPDFAGVNLNRNLAPFVDVNNDGIYDPLLGDYPDIKGDQSIWWIMNDVGNVKLFIGNTPINSRTEIQAMAYGYNTSDDLNNSTVYDYKIINKGVDVFDQTHFGFWSDPDLGFPNDDRIGCNIKRGLGYVYNDKPFDGTLSSAVPSYGYNPPLSGIKVIKGPLAPLNDGLDNNFNGIIDEPGETIKMSSFNYEVIGLNPINGDPATPLDFYRYLQGLPRTGDTIYYSQLYPFQLPQVRFTFFAPGTSHLETPIPLPNVNNPNFNNALTEQALGFLPGDRRFTIGLGPITFLPGQTENLTFATVYTRTYRSTFNEQFEDFLINSDQVQCLLDSTCAQPTSFYAPTSTVSQELVGMRINWLPDTFSVVSATNTVVKVQTESYLENFNNITYAFQGYQVFQVRSKDFDLSLLDDANFSRQIAQFDIIDSISNLSNLEITQSAGPLTSVLKVAGNNLGIQRTFYQTVDPFTNQLIDFTTEKHYVVVAYASAIPVNSTVRPYLRSRKNVKVVSYYPPKQSNFLTSQGFKVTRKFGRGGSGSSLSTEQGTSDSIISSLVPTNIRYNAGRAPIQVYKLPGGITPASSFVLELSSSIRYNQLIGTVQIGDTIACTGSFQFQSIDTTIQNKIIIPGRAVVLRNLIGNQSGEGILDVKMLNDFNGGTFTLPGALMINNYTFKELEIPLAFQGPSFSAIATEFKIADFARIVQLDSQIVSYLPQRLSVANHQVLLGYGLGFKISSIQPYTLYDEHSLDKIHKFTYSTIDSSSNIVPVRNTLTSLFVNNGQLTSTTLVKKGIDVEGWIPYRFAKPMNQFSSTNQVSAPQNQGVSRYYGGNNNINDINAQEQLIERTSSTGNFKIVFTSDTSLWSRVAVLQYRFRSGSVNFNRNRLLRSMEPSKNRQLQTDSVFVNGKLSRGMSWFPGYAIDMDKGVRVNMMFCEDRNLPNGNNLIWEPDSTEFGGNNFVYVLQSEYSPDFEAVLDSIDPLQNSNSNIKYLEYLNKNVSWVGLFKSKSTFTIPEVEFFLSAEVPFRSNGDGRLPTFYFDGAQAPVGVKLNQETEISKNCILILLEI